MGCRDPSDDDQFRALTLHLAGGLVEDTIEQVQLCPGARVYSYTLVVKHPGNEAGVVPETGASLLLQDSQLDVCMLDCKTVSLSADLPGLKWPSFARLRVTAGGRACLTLIYGNCKT